MPTEQKPNYIINIVTPIKNEAEGIDILTREIKKVVGFYKGRFLLELNQKDNIEANTLAERVGVCNKAIYKSIAKFQETSSNINSSLDVGIKELEEVKNQATSINQS